jgi:hypothetical protein
MSGFNQTCSIHINDAPLKCTPRPFQFGTVDADSVAGRIKILVQCADSPERTQSTLNKRAWEKPTVCLLLSSYINEIIGIGKIDLQCCGRCRLSLLAIGKACGCEDSEESIGRDSQMPLQQIRRVRTLPYTLDLESMDDAGLSQAPQMSIEIRERISAEAIHSALLPRRCLTKPPERLRVHSRDGGGLRAPDQRKSSSSYLTDAFGAFRRWPASSALAEVIGGSSPTFRQHGNLERGHNNRLAG